MKKETGKVSEKDANKTDVVSTALDTAIEQAQPEHAVPAIGIRLNFSNGTAMKFEFMANDSAVALANEINSHLQDKVEILSIKDENKRFFKAGDVLPKRKCTIDIIQQGVLVKSSLMGVPVAPSLIFNKDGKFFAALLGVLISQSNKRLANANKLQLIA